MSSKPGSSKGRGGGKGGKQGEDPRKKAGDQGKQLGKGQPRGTPTPGPISEKIHLLIINGGGHQAFLGDFLGLVRYFEKWTSPVFRGEFWTAEHPDAYFNQNPQYTDIKFGGDSAMSQTEVVYTKGQTGVQNWQYTGPDDLVKRLFAWMSSKCDPTYKYPVKAGDSVIIILLAHGLADRLTRAAKGCKLGDEVLLVTEFVEKLRLFPRSIQVNIISSACYSGLFAEKLREDGQQQRLVLAAGQKDQKAFAAARSVSNRFRNGLFIAGVVRSLGGFQATTRTPILKDVKADQVQATQSLLKGTATTQYDWIVVVY